MKFLTAALSIVMQLVQQVSFLSLSHLSRLLEPIDLYISVQYIGAFCYMMVYVENLACFSSSKHWAWRGIVPISASCTSGWSH